MYINKATLWVGGIFGFILAVSVTMFSGCNLKGATGLVMPTATITDVQGDLKKDATTLEGTTGQIKDSATNGQKATPPAVQPILVPYWQNILVQAGIQENVITDLRAKDGQLTQAVAQAKAVQDALVKETAAKDKAVADLQNTLNQKLVLLILLGVLGLGGAAWLAFSGSNLGIGVAVVSATLIVASLFIIKLNTFNIPPVAVYIGIGVITLICTGFGIYYFYQHKKTTAVVTTQNKVLNTQVKTLTDNKVELESKVDLTSKSLSKLMIEHGALLSTHKVVAEKLTLVSDEKARLTEVHQIVKTSVEVKLDSIDSRVGKLEDNSKQLEARTSVVEKDTLDLKAKVPVLAKKIALAKTTADNTKSYVEGINAGMARSRLSGQDIWTGRAAGN